MKQTIPSESRRQERVGVATSVGVSVAVGVSDGTGVSVSVAVAVGEAVKVEVGCGVGVAVGALPIARSWAALTIDEPYPAAGDPERSEKLLVVLSTALALAN